jgi:hypothetical protein
VETENKEQNDSTKTCDEPAAPNSPLSVEELEGSARYVMQDAGAIGQGNVGHFGQGRLVDPAANLAHQDFPLINVNAL